jgi:HicB family
MRKSNFMLRVPPNLLSEARRAAETEGIALNQLITLALAEKVSAIRKQAYFEERARRADRKKVDEILARVGKGNPPIEGDELPEELVAVVAKKKNGRR